MASSRLEIDLGAIDRNLGVVRRTIGPAENAPSPHRPAVCAVLKQDGYGAGAVRIAKRLVASGVEMLAVYALDEARALAEAIPTVPILILMPTRGLDRHDPLYRHAVAGRIHFSVHSLDQFASLNETAARLGAELPVHLQADTGLSRGGASVGDSNEALLLLQRIVASPRVRLAGLMTHFASPCCDDEFTREQARLFRDFIESIRPVVRAAVEQGGRAVARMNDLVVHAANSCATFRSRSYHGTMVRVGQCLLGYVGADVPQREHFEFRDEMESLEPSIRWIAPIAHVQEIPVGWPVGYGSTWRAPQRLDGRATRIALIPVGYADGLPRTLGGRSNLAGGIGGGPGCVGFTGRLYDDTAQSGGMTIAPTASETIYAPIVGRVSMDQITVDVTDVPESFLRIARPGTVGGSGSGDPRGSEVEIYSRDPAARTFLPTTADTAGTITHDLLCRVSPRVERVYKVSAALEPVAEPTRAPLPMPVIVPTLAGKAAVA